MSVCTRAGRFDRSELKPFFFAAYGSFGCGDVGGVYSAVEVRR
jgi:hypothetical protein